MTKLPFSTLRRMKAVSRISAANVETLASIESSIEIRAKSCMVMGNQACVAGTLGRYEQLLPHRQVTYNEPICAIITTRATERR